MIRRQWMAAAVMVMALGASALAVRRLDNPTYVQSGPGGVFYARCTPAATTGPAGRTDVYRVDRDADVAIDRYDWYAPSGVTLGWSPLAGKIAVMAAMADERGADWLAVEELRFSIGGERLASWTNEQLIALGAQMVISSHGGQHADYRTGTCEQVPGTNEYDFIVELNGRTEVRFNILTGKPRVPATRPAGPQS